MASRSTAPKEDTLVLAGGVIPEKTGTN